MEKTAIEVSNPSGSALVSDVLRDFKGMLRTQASAVLREESSPSSNTKGEIITAIAVGLVTSAIYDLLKAAVMRMRRRPDFDDAAIVLIDGHEITLGALAEVDKK